MIEADRIDWAASPTLSSLMDLIGVSKTIELVRARGGTEIYIPAIADPETVLAKIIGIEATAKIIEHFGHTRHIDIPTGRGLAHGRRLDHARIVKLSTRGWSAAQIARECDCSTRQVEYILSTARGRAADRQLRLL